MAWRFKPSRPSGEIYGANELDPRPSLPLLAHIWPRSGTADAIENIVNLFGFIGLNWSHPPGSTRRPADYEVPAAAPNAPFSVCDYACFQQSGEAAFAQTASSTVPETSGSDTVLSQLRESPGDADFSAGNQRLVFSPGRLQLV
jgi:hypothetical protein